MIEPGRGDLSPSRLEEHVHATAKRLRKLGVQPGSTVVSLLPAGPDAASAALAVERADADFTALSCCESVGHYRDLLRRLEPRLMILPIGPHPAREAAHHLQIPVADVFRHFEAGLFTLELDFPLPRSRRKLARGVPVILIAPDNHFRALAKRLDATHPVVGITPPSLDRLALPHTIEHVAADCVRMLRSYRPHGPYALAGWRADSLIALEMACLLEEAGDKVVFVAMLDPAGNLDRPRHWFGKVLHLRPQSRRISGQGMVCYDAPAEMLAEPNVQIVATIFAAELV